jgi:cleavage and polyadenylation specificity factor subunit 1
METCVDDQNSSRLLVREINSRKLFLIDTGADISVIPPNIFKISSTDSNFNLFAANGTQVKTYGTSLINLDLGLRRVFKWTFVIADVSSPIIGADFLKHTGLLVDIQRKRIIDPLTSLFSIGKISNCPIISLTKIDQSQLLPEISQLLSKFSELTRDNLKVHAVKHDVTHRLDTNGPPISYKARRLPADKLKLAKDEFQSMMEQGICRPSNSAWASPLHMVKKKMVLGGLVETIEH